MSDDLPLPREGRPTGPVPERRSGVVTLLFTDVVGSTALKQRLGDRAGVQLTQEHHTLIRSTLAQFPGAEEIVVAGDSFLVLFPVPSEAVHCALVLQRRLAQFNQGRPVPVPDRIGLHLGEVLIQEKEAGQRDVHGIQVDTCARVMSLAQAGQILLTRPVFDNARQSLKGEAIEGVGGLDWLNHGRFELKGVDEPVEICEVRAAEAAHLSPPTTSEKARRVEAVEGEAVLGWRPAVGTLVPSTKWVLEQRLGEGGFGEVWVGRHQVMKERRVFKFCFRADRVRSLKREMTLFRLIKQRIGDHPNIVSLREVYFDEPPYYVEMDYAEGQDLASWCAAQGGAEKVPLETKLELVAQIADALQAAHDAGVIHRDVKPANILVSSQWSVVSGARSVVRDPSSLAPRPSSLTAKLTDFGIGQVVSEEALAGVTRAGFTQTMLSSSSSQTGTQLYMAPELLEGKPASTRSDIFSLGVVLYQLVVADFKRSVATDWARQVEEPLLREDLQHCFAGNPEDRFAGAVQLARQLRNWASRKAELARLQVEKAERESLRRQAERRRRMLVAGGLVGLVLVALSAALGYGLRQAQQAREQQRRSAYASDMKAAQVALEQNNRGLAVNLLRRHVPQRGEQELRSIEWRYLWQLSQSDELKRFTHPGFVNGCSLSPDGRYLATTCLDYKARIWERDSGKVIHEFACVGIVFPRYLAAFSPDGSWLAVLGKAGIEIRDTVSWKVVKELTGIQFEPAPTSICISRNGRVLVSGVTNGLAAWDAGDWSCRVLTNAPFPRMQNLAVSATGALIAYSKATPSYNTLAPIELWNLETGTTRTLGQDLDVTSLEFSPDGKWLASGHDSGAVCLWDLRSMQPVRTNRFHQLMVYGLAFAPDAATLASASGDQLIQLWTLGAEKPFRTLQGHESAIYGLSFSGNGRLLASAGQDGSARLWELQRMDPHSRSFTVPADTVPVGVTPDGNSLLTTDRKYNTTVRWQLPDGDLVHSNSWIAARQLGCTALRFFAKQQLTVGVTSNGTVHLWDLETGVHQKTIPLGGWSFDPQFLSADQRWLVGKDTTRLFLFDLPAGQKVPAFAFNWRWTFGAAFSPDNRWLAYSYSVENSHFLALWDLSSGRPKRAFGEFTLPIASLVFSPDGEKLVSAGWDGEIRVWSARTGKLLVPPMKRYIVAVGGLAFSADGKTLAGFGGERSIRLWSIATGQEMLLFQNFSVTADESPAINEYLSGQAFLTAGDRWLLWKERGGPVRVTPLPTLAEIDALARETSKRHE